MQTGNRQLTVMFTHPTPKPDTQKHPRARGNWFANTQPQFPPLYPSCPIQDKSPQARDIFLSKLPDRFLPEKTKINILPENSSMQTHLETEIHLHFLMRTGLIFKKLQLCLFLLQQYLSLGHTMEAVKYQISDVSDTIFPQGEDTTENEGSHLCCEGPCHSI